MMMVGAMVSMVAVAAHIVVKRANLWTKLGELRAMGATGIVALNTDAIVA